jgi:hypothetical protein
MPLACTLPRAYMFRFFNITIPLEKFQGFSPQKAIIPPIRFTET